MQYAIVEFAGKQFLIEPNQEVHLVGHWGKVGETLKLDKVLAMNNKTFELGTPYLEASISATIKEHSKGKKIKVRTYKAKSRYRRHIGYRSLQTVVTILPFDQTASSKKSTPATSKPSSTPKKTAKTTS